MYVKVSVTAGAKKDEIVRTTGDRFVVSVRAEAKGGKANARVLELVRQEFGPRASARIVSGHHSPSKIVSVDVHPVNEK